MFADDFGMPGSESGLPGHLENVYVCVGTFLCFHVDIEFVRGVNLLIIHTYSFFFFKLFFKSNTISLYTDFLSLSRGEIHTRQRKKSVITLSDRVELSPNIQ